MNLAEKLVMYAEFNGDYVARENGQCNIFYLEGANLDGSENADQPDRWNDIRVVVVFTDGVPEVKHLAVATTEPGIAPTHSLAAKKRGGVARIILGQQRAWKMGFHKGNPSHPALVQAAPVLVHRDTNEDYLRSGDRIAHASGINQHSTSPKFNGISVGDFSEGCLVGKEWGLHLQFIELIKSDPRFIANKDYIFHTAVYGGDSFNKFLRKSNVA